MAKLDRDFKALQNKLDRMERMGERTVANNYKKLLDDLRISMSKLYESYEVNGQLTLAEMNKYNRLQKLDKEVYDKVMKLYSSNSKVIRGTLQGITRDTYTNSISIVEKASGTKIKGILKDLPVTEIINDDMAGLNWMDRTNHYRSNAIYEIQKEIKEGLKIGETYSTMTKRLKKTLEEDTKKINTIVRTESHRIKGQAKEESFDRIEKAGVKFKEKWLSARDGDRVRTNHQILDGTIINRGELFESPSGSVGKGPGLMEGPDSAKDNINCRCIKVLVLEG